MRDIPLHDIKPLVEVPDNSLIYAGIAVFVFAVVVILAAVWIYRHFAKAKEEDLRKSYLQKIHKVDTGNAKQAAYEISSYGRFLAQSERAKDMLDNLDQRLSKYKYKKEVEALDDETLGYYKLFLEVLDAS
jgi:hypothetical protein